MIPETARILSKGARCVNSRDGPSHEECRQAIEARQGTLLPDHDEDGEDAGTHGGPDQGDAQRVASDILGLAKEKVRIHTTFSGGGFGRRLESDYVL